MVHRRKQPKWLCNDAKTTKNYQFTTTTTLDAILNTPDDSDYGYYIVCDIDYTNSCKDRTEQLALMPHKRKINDNELGYRERDGGKARSVELIFDQNNKTIYGSL